MSKIYSLYSLWGIFSKSPSGNLLSNSYSGASPQSPPPGTSSKTPTAPTRGALQGHSGPFRDDIMKRFLPESVEELDEELSQKTPAPNST